jgi:hypothetical protein
VLQLLSHAEKKPRGATIPLEEKTLSTVAAFYTHDEVSRQSPGMRDFIKIKGLNGEVSTLQKVS